LILDFPLQPHNRLCILKVDTGEVMTMRRFVSLLAFIGCLCLAPIGAIAQDYRDLLQSFRAETLTYDDKRFLQTALAFNGHYNGLLDGDWGPRSQRAMESYAQAEFGSAAEEWHLAFLAFSFIDLFERDGWGMFRMNSFGLSLLYPYTAVVTDPSTEYFVNWRHRFSSLSYSTGIHDRQNVQNVHDYTESVHSSSTELYILRRPSLAVTSATRNDGSVLYTRSNFINGLWHTAMLSADRQDVPILNAVAASITVGSSRNISITRDGPLETIVMQTLAIINEQDSASNAPQQSAQVSAPEVAHISTGTGFIVSSQGFALTNAHVVQGCVQVTYDGLPASVVSQSEEYDLALLQIPDWSGDVVATFSPAPARLNSDVTVVGFPLSGLLSGLNVTRGAVSSSLGFGGDMSGMQITAPVQPGNSGGPLLAADGEVVGVVVSKLDAQYVADLTGDIPQNVNFAIRGELAKLFLFQNGVEPVLGTSDAPVAPVDIAQIASAYTGFIECRQ
jgi:serine protease Do